MSFPVSIILTILKSIVSNEVQSQLANELIGISMDGLSEISVNKLSEFIEIQKSKIEHILPIMSSPKSLIFQAFL